MPVGQRNLACGSPSSLDDGWVVASPDSVGMDGADSAASPRGWAAQHRDPFVVVARHGRLVFEQYFAGIDQPWGQGGPHEFTATTNTICVRHRRA